MSWLNCEECCGFINTDSDPDCFVEVGNMRRMNREIVLCETCRWLREDERERHEHEMAMAEAGAEAIETATHAYGVGHE